MAVLRQEAAEAETREAGQVSAQHKGDAEIAQALAEEAEQSVVAQGES